MRPLLALLLALAGAAGAQTREVFPGELSLEVTVENGSVTPYAQEMVLLTIHGQYRRHITRENLEQPDLQGFNWMQLGPDHWFDTQVRGIKVKNLVRRMALYPDRAGTLTIGPFVHHLTLTDEGDDWFDHAIRSEPLTLEVQPAPAGGGWWFPVRQLQVSDTWSNAPDQLKPGEGVLRVIRVEAVGVAPDMIPPMPELKSPSAMIFAHPEQRLVELSPEGPVSVAFWRWTIRPANGTSAILEPISFDFFDTRNRVARSVTISAQRVAMDQSTLPPPNVPPVPSGLHRGWVLAALTLALAAGLGALLPGRRFAGLERFRRLTWADPLRRALRRAARAGDLPGLRRAARGLAARSADTPARQALLAGLDRAIYAPPPVDFDAAGFARRFLAAGRRRKTETIG